MAAVTTPIGAQSSRVPRTLKQLISQALREPHPVEFKPVIFKPHARPSLSHYGMRAIPTTLIWAGFMTCILGWPLAAKAFIQMSNGVYGYEWTPKSQRKSSV
ncbi:hypothetical protein M433DRAFT_154462 [Acidomyces richmondensis BFW]|nr:MAG: hypothetical protein FE78DRAFT_90555 [Acidomyces sp. 'richmondensis']KYG45475.1 hypothetical protein M433DRAFT_154462 [Acidomyces richmondensis BFW]